MHLKYLTGRLSGTFGDVPDVEGQFLITTGQAELAAVPLVEEVPPVSPVQAPVVEAKADPEPDPKASRTRHRS